jgi:hypothetical protein
MENYVRPPQEPWITARLDKGKPRGGYRFNDRWTEADVNNVVRFVKAGWSAATIAREMESTEDEIMTLMAERGVYVR